MNEHNSADYLFEVSWEVCNKVGGIHTVVKTKLPHAVAQFGDNYILIGPDVGNNPEFEETTEDLWPFVMEQARRRDLSCRCGRWKASGNARVILVNHNNKYRINELLFQLWQDFGVDSMAGEWDYMEPVIFGTAAGEIIQILHARLVDEKAVAVAQFHEWMSAAGMFYVKKHVPEIATVLTSHATMLGRALSSGGQDIYRDIESISPQAAAARVNITAKHSMETVAAREADCFTTVSEICAREATHFLQRPPDVVLPNGITLDDIPDCKTLRQSHDDRVKTVREFAAKFLQQELDPEQTRLMIISGRYEFHNKGIDLFLEALKSINDTLAEQRDATQIVAFLCVIGGHVGVSDEAQQIFKGADIQRTGVARICTHRLQNPQNDPIWNTCNRLNLLNSTDDRVKVIFMPVYLDGYDGILNVPYYDVLSGCDLGVFPSYYEPWGYTPLECVAYCVPAVTTDLAGFGLWVKNHFQEENNGVVVLDYNGNDHNQTRDSLKAHLMSAIAWSPEERGVRSTKARDIAEKATWNAFFPYYLQSYEKAVQVSRDRILILDTSAYRREIRYVGTDSIQPRFRSFSVIAPIPESISRLREIAYNMYWAWNADVKELFARLDPNKWEEVFHNPVEMLERVDARRLLEMASNESYLALYRKVVDWMEQREAEDDYGSQGKPVISREAPVAYFSTEYALHSSLPIYSGGLGVLSADHLKSASDLNIPMVGVGMLFKNGYFVQKINAEGNQEAFYPENDFSRMPVRLYETANREPLKISVDLPGRKLYAQVWKVDVGRVPLYLLDTYVPENSSQDMQITSRLYAGDQRLRIEQEIMLGIGGVKVLDALSITPSLYHLNEGHSAFLLIERMRFLVEREGMSFYEAREAVKSSSVFTTHSPVEAANERFEESLMRSYFSDYVETFGISWETFWELGRAEPGAGKPFFMTVLALKLTSAANAVSRLHGRVARNMWKNVWSGYEENEIPIVHVTNGVHVQTWTADEMREHYEKYLGINFYAKDFDRQNWDKIDDIPDGELWQIRRELKIKMVDFIRTRIGTDCDCQGVSPRLKQKKLAALDADALIIGFARRFAAYKRAGLLFEDPERLLSILENADQPVHIVFAGKAHPNDDAGKEILTRIWRYSLDERFLDKIFFVQNYNLNVGRHLIRGVDVWLNNPIRPKEACGTSGMKVVLNGGLNFSVLDGWWDEAYGGDNGWAIGGRNELENVEMKNLADNQSLLDVLEHMVIPAYCDRNGDDIPERWIAMMKQSIKGLVPQFNSHRMLRDYYETMYDPVASRARALQENAYARVKGLAAWKLDVAPRFSTDHIRWVTVKGCMGDRIQVGETLDIAVGVEYGKLTEEEMRVELVMVQLAETGERIYTITALHRDSVDDDQAVVYRGQYVAEQSGRFMYGVRVIPTHPDLLRYQELGLVHWA